MVEGRTGTVRDVACALALLQGLRGSGKDRGEGGDAGRVRSIISQERVSLRVHFCVQPFHLDTSGSADILRAGQPWL